MLALACLLAAAVTWAQKRKGHKLRATAVVEVAKDSSGVVTTRIIPVTILDDGRFQDAGTYKASPRPMALDNGIVYEAQASGIPVGTATITSSASRKDSWTALGKWQLITATAKKPDAKPSVTTDDRPVLHRPGSGDSSSSTSTGSNGSSDDRPVLHRPDSGASSNPSSNSPAPSSAPTPSSSSGDRPVLHRPESSSASSTPSSTASQSADNISDSTVEDPDRPALRRHNSPGQETPAQMQPQTKPASANSTAHPARKPMIVPDTKTYVAVSDTVPTDARSFIFQWKAGEEEAIAPKMRKLALEQLPKGQAQLSPNAFKNVVLRSFDLDLSNDAVIVFSGEITDSPAVNSAMLAKTRAKETPEKSVTRYVTVIARVDFEGEPQKVFANVTDSSRLDVTPRLELIDAVDVDGDGNAELLFREYGYEDTGFVIYSVGRSIVNKLFESESTQS